MPHTPNHAPFAPRTPGRNAYLKVRLTEKEKSLLDRMAIAKRTSTGELIRGIVEAYYAQVAHTIS